MLSAKAIKSWYLIHKWTSLISTACLLMLCLTGLPLIFYEEIEHLLGRHPEASPMAEGTPLASLDRVVEAGLAARPGEVAQYLSFDEHDAPLLYLATALAVDSPEVSHLATFDARTAELIEAPPFNEGIMWLLFRLHYDMFAGLPGSLFLGVMGVLFVAAIISGIVVYEPFMRKLPFGTVRAERSTRVRWLDLHNLLGVVTIAWALVVGATGVINTWGTLIRDLWRIDQLAEMVAPNRDRPPVARLASIDAAVATARAAAPGMTPLFVAFPGTPFSSPHHFAVFMRGQTPLTAQLLKPALVDAETGELTDIRAMPWYVTALFLSRPLHFGDYGGMPLKIIWALLDIVTMVVLGSGLYLWLGRRKTSLEARLAELEVDEAGRAAAVSQRSAR